MNDTPATPSPSVALKLPLKAIHWLEADHMDIEDATGVTLANFDEYEGIVRMVNLFPELVAALEAYGAHTARCDVRSPTMRPCDCGLHAILAKAKGTTP